MRGGPFSETRVIDLLNHRFVPFFYNTGGPGLGKDAQASAFIRGKVPNRWAFFAVFAPDGSVLGVTEIYAGTEDVAAFLAELLRAHPEFDRDTPAEAKVLAGAKAEEPAAAVAAGALAETLSRPVPAVAAYALALAKGTPEEQAAAYRGLLRLARQQGDWPAHANWLTTATAAAVKPRLEVDLTLEQGYRLMAQRRFAHARALLQPATRTALTSPRLAELHYEAGRACWFMGDRDWAKLHWCWIIEHLPDDRFYMRASLAAAADVFPYPNQELGGFEASVGPVGPGIIGEGVAAARTTYEKLLPRFEAADYGQAAVDDEAEVTLTKVEPRSAACLDLPQSLVARLRDEEPAGTNDRGIERLVAMGEDAVIPLLVAARNEDFLGRVAVATALGRVLAAHPDMTAANRKYAVESLQLLAKATAAPVAAAARAALAPLDNARSDAQREAAEPLPKSPTLLVALLRDGNDHRVANNRIVDALVSIGEPALVPLRTAFADRDYAARGYAVFAIGRVLQQLGTRPKEYVQLVTDAASDTDPYVRALATSARKLLDTETKAPR